MNTKMKNQFSRIYIPPEVRRKMIEIAREFRKVPTKGENILWEALRGKKLDGIKLRRQQPVGFFVVDFYSSVYRLVVEVDGPVHMSQKEADNARQEILEELGLAVLRIKSEVVERNLLEALDLIRQAIHNQAKRNEIPSPYLGEGQGGG
jgi:very-short-patch-repair endonuclease